MYANLLSTEHTRVIKKNLISRDNVPVEAGVYGARLVSIIIHAKDTMHTCIAKFTCMKPNSCE